MFHYLIKEDEFLPVQEISETGLDALNSSERRKMLDIISDNQVSVSELAEELDMDRQTLYYNLEKLSEAELIDSEGSRPKYYSSDSVAYYYRPENVEPEENPVAMGEVPELMEGFVEQRRIKTRIVVGAPYPHGENDRKHRTSYLAADLACQLGNYGSRSKQLIYSDVEAENLDDAPEIIIGGFRVNQKAKELYTRFPAKFSSSGQEILTDTGNSYTGADTGYISKTIIDGVPKMIVAGISGLGTSAAIRALSSRIDELGSKGAVVRGYGTKERVEEVKILEKLD